MNITTTLFIVSIIGIITMLYIKVREIQSGKLLYPEKVRLGLDAGVEGVIDKIHNKSQELNHVSFSIILARLMRMITLSSRMMYKVAIQSENKILNFIKGKRTLERTARRSDFLESIESHKRENVHVEEEEEEEKTQNLKIKNQKIDKSTEEEEE